MSTSRRALDSKQICEQLHDVLDSFCEISQNSDIDLIVHSDPDAKINEPDLNNSDGNSDDCQASTTVGGVGGNDEDNGNDDWAVWDKNDHDFSEVPILASSGHNPP